MGDVSATPAGLAGLSPEEVRRYARHLIIPRSDARVRRSSRTRACSSSARAGLGSPLRRCTSRRRESARSASWTSTSWTTSNLQRQMLFGARDVGRPKLEAAAERLAEINPHVRSTASRRGSPPRTRSSIIRGLRHRRRRHRQLPDALPGQRRLRAPRQAQRLRLRSSASRARRPSSPRSGPCYRCLYPEPPPPGLVPSCAEGGVLGVLPGIIGSIQAVEMIKLDSRRGRAARRAGCCSSTRSPWSSASSGCARTRNARSAASTDGHELIDYEEFCWDTSGTRGGDEDGVPTITVEGLKALLDEGSDELFVLDVREPHESDIVA